MQILVVVANIQSRPLKTEVEKVSVRTAFGHGSVGPNPNGNPLLAKAGGPVVGATWRRGSTSAVGEREIGQHSYTNNAGIRGIDAGDDVGAVVAWP